MKTVQFGTISTAWVFQMKFLIAQMFPGSVKLIKFCKTLCHPQLVIFLVKCLDCIKENERVVGWEGSIAELPPHDGAAWALGNCFWGAENTA